MDIIESIKTPQNIDLMEIFDEVYEGMYISYETYNNGDFEYQHVIEVNTLPDEPEKSYIIWGVAKTKEHLTDEKLNDVLDSSCVDYDQCITVDVFSHGLFATIDNDIVDNNEVENILKQIPSRVSVVNQLFGYYMDKPLNRIGNTGWDFLDGNIG